MKALQILTAARDPVGLADAEDAPLMAALAERGASVQRRAWTDVGDGEPGLRILRTIWDYSEQVARFRAWLQRQSPDRLINPPELVAWNLDKRYLMALADGGLPVVPTRRLESGAGHELLAQLARMEAAEVVVKPAVSASGRATRRLSPRPDRATLDWLEARLEREPFVIQPFDRRVLERGELSFVWIDGRITHAVCKRAREGEFRVQQEHGGRWQRHEPTPAQRQWVERFIAACPVRPVFARVDGFSDDEGGFTLMELELIEPELFLPDHPHAAAELAEALLLRC